MFFRVLFVFVCATFLSNTSSAGEVVFHNQDSLKGELFAIQLGHIVWASETIGHVTIPKGAIKSMYTSSPLKIPGQREVCYWAGLEGLDARIQCAEEEAFVVTFSSLNDVLLLEGLANQGHHYQGKLIGIGSQSEGNKNRQDWLVDADIILRHFEFRHSVGLKYEAEANEDESLQEEYEATYALDWFFSVRTFWFAESSARRDERRDIDLRFTFGTGVGYQFWDTGKTALSVKTGGEYVNETFLTAEESDDRFFSWRLATSYRYRFPREIAFYANADYLQSVDSGEEWEAQAETGISLPIAMGITADVKYEYDIDNTPPEGLEKTDSTLRFGFGYQW